MNLHLRDIDSEAADRIIELAFTAANRQNNIHRRVEDKHLIRDFAAVVAREKDRQTRSQGVVGF